MLNNLVARSQWLHDEGISRTQHCKSQKRGFKSLSRRPFQQLMLPNNGRCSQPRWEQRPEEHLSGMPRIQHFYGFRQVQGSMFNIDSYGYDSGNTNHYTLEPILSPSVALMSMTGPCLGRCTPDHLFCLTSSLVNISRCSPQSEPPHIGLCKLDGKEKNKQRYS